MEAQELFDYLRPELRTFVEGMEKALRSNDWKGGWKGMDLSECIKRLKQEMYELENETVNFPKFNLEHDHVLRDWINPVATLQEAVDVANFAMFTADVAGALAPATPAAE